jgi:hypothetical protein
MDQASTAISLTMKSTVSAELGTRRDITLLVTRDDPVTVAASFGHVLIQ